MNKLKSYAASKRGRDTLLCFGIVIIAYIIVQAAIDEKADIIALSALMTTTMMRMKDVFQRCSGLLLPDHL